MSSSYHTELPGEEALCKCKVSFGYDWRILCVVNHWRNVSEGSRWCQCDFWKQFPKRPGVCSGNSLARLPIFKRNCSYFSWYWAGISFKKFIQDFKKPCHVCLFFFSHQAVMFLQDESYLVYFENATLHD